MSEIVEEVENRSDTATKEVSSDKSSEETPSEEKGRPYQRRGGPNAGGFQQGGKRSFYFRKKVCTIFKGPEGEKLLKTLSYKDYDILRNFISEKGKILPRRLTGTTAKEQRVVTRVIKRARNAGVLHFTRI